MHIIHIKSSSTKIPPRFDTDSDYVYLKKSETCPKVRCKLYARMNTKGYNNKLIQSKVVGFHKKFKLICGNK